MTNIENPNTASPTLKLIFCLMLRNLRYLMIWLKINAVLIILGVVFSILCIAIIATFNTFMNGLLNFCIGAYIWIVVYQFYKDEKASELINIEN